MAVKINFHDDESMCSIVMACIAFRWFLTIDQRLLWKLEVHFYLIRLSNSLLGDCNIQITIDSVTVSISVVGSTQQTVV